MRFALFFAVFWASVIVGDAHAGRNIEFADAPDGNDGLIIGLAPEGDLGALEPIIGEASFANLERAVAQSGFTATPGASKTFLTGGETFGEIHLIGLDRGEMAARHWEDFGGRAAKIAAKSKTEKISVMALAKPDAPLSAIGFGALLGQYSFDKYKTGHTPKNGSLVLIGSGSADAGATFNAGRKQVADSIIWARNIISEPANVIYPASFVSSVRQSLKGVPNVSITVLNEKQMARLGMGAIVGVGQGSERPPRLLIISYNGAGAESQPVVFAGKGITFDTGGISLKNKSGMWRMKYDMTGAASVSGAVMGLAKSRAPVNVIAIAALAENMPSGSAQRPGDVVTTMSGKTIEIMSTDAEGRLVLADAVWYAQEKFNPALLVDIATLTGSVRTALSDEYAGLFVRDNAIAKKMISAGERAGEDLWQLPLHKNYDKQIKSVIADIKNSDAGNPGAGVGAAVIGTFVREETPWAHLDIAGVGWRTDPTPTTPNGASAFGIRLLDQLARDHAAQ